VSAAIRATVAAYDAAAEEEAALARASELERELADVRERLSAARARRSLGAMGPPERELGGGGGGGGAATPSAAAPEGVAADIEIEDDRVRDALAAATARATAADAAARAATARAVAAQAALNERDTALHTTLVASDADSEGDAADAEPEPAQTPGARKRRRAKAKAARKAARVE
jgi:NADH-quinone oxidoreductase subunit C